MNVVKPVESHEVEIDFVTPVEPITEERVIELVKVEIDGVKLPSARDINDIFGVIDVTGQAVLKVIVLIDSGATPANVVKVTARYTLDEDAVHVQEALTDAFGIATFTGIRGGDWVITVDDNNPVLSGKQIVGGSNPATVEVSGLENVTNTYTLSFA